MTARLDRLLPHPQENLDEDTLVRLYDSGRAGRQGPRCTVNGIQSVDGAATLHGRSGGLGGPGDRRVFAVLRRLTDVVLVGAGTVRAEGYAGPLVDGNDRAAREKRGMPGHPLLAIVSGTLDLDPASALFQQAPRRPVILTTEHADPVRRDALAAVAEVVPCGDATLDPLGAMEEFRRRGAGRVLLEGGPSLLSVFLRADLVDEYCLSLSPMAEGGEGPRLSHASAEASPVPLQLRHVLADPGGLLLLRYERGEG